MKTGIRVSTIVENNETEVQGTGGILPLNQEILENHKSLQKCHSTILIQKI